MGSYYPLDDSLLILKNVFSPTSKIVTDSLPSPKALSDMIPSYLTKELFPTQREEWVQTKERLEQSKTETAEFTPHA